MSNSTPVPKYRHHKGSGQSFVQVAGKRHYLGKWNTPASKERYSRFVAELASSPTATPPPTAQDASTITVVEVAAAYLDHAERYYQKDGRPSGHLPPLRAALRILRQLYGSVPAADFGPLALRALQQKMVADGAARSYINQHTGQTKRLFKWAVSVELLPPSVYHALVTVPGLKRGRTAARETAPILPVADELVEATLPYMPPIVAAMVQFQRLTGCRPGEVCQLRPRDLDRSGEVWRYSPASHKTAYRGRERTIYVGPKAQRVIEPYLLRAADAHCFSPAESVAQQNEEKRANRKTRVQPSQRNRRKAKPARTPAMCYVKDSYQRAIARAVVKANKTRTDEASDMGIAPILLPHWHANQLRHTRATEVRREFGLEAAQVVLGHARADVTQTYAERDARLAVEVSKKTG
ncbi:MAG: site-specific integrase [Planctomycetia bacterium]|nr:site-specific integrase [Planctomycetia bacterium]